MSTFDLSVVTTLYQSAPHLQSFYERVSETAKKITSHYEIILVNDGSPDESLQLAIGLHEKDPHVVVIDLTRNFGHHHALWIGLQQARGAHVFLLDSDLEEQPEWLIPFHDLLAQEKADVVYGIQRSRKGDLWERSLGALFYRLFNFLSPYPIPPSAAIARLMSRRYVDSLLLFDERELFLPGLWQMTGYRQVACPVSKGNKGTSSYSFAHRIALSVNAITSFTHKPLLYISYTGMFFSLVSGLYIFRLLVKKVAYGVPIMGWSSLIVSIWFLGGLTIFFIGVVGIYIAKVYSEIKHRPLALVRRRYDRLDQAQVK